MFHVWINCSFFDKNGVIVIDKMMLDSAHRVTFFDIIKI